jgi:uncharacterized protein with HEPN domain
MNLRDQAVLQDIAKAAQIALEFSTDMGQQEFEADLKPQSSA